MSLLHRHMLPLRQRSRVIPPTMDGMRWPLDAQVVRCRESVDFGERGIDPLIPESVVEDRETGGGSIEETPQDFLVLVRICQVADARNKQRIVASLQGYTQRQVARERRSVSTAPFDVAADPDAPSLAGLNVAIHVSVVL